MQIYTEKNTKTSPDGRFREVAFLQACVICVFASGVRACEAVIVCVCAYSPFTPACSFSVTLMMLCSKIKNLSPSSFLSVCRSVGKITLAGKSCGRASLKVVHLERLTAGVGEVGSAGAGKFSSYFRSLSLQCFFILNCVYVMNKERKET